MESGAANNHAITKAVIIAAALVSAFAALHGSVYIPLENRSPTHDELNIFRTDLMQRLDALDRRLDRIEPNCRKAADRATGEQHGGSIGG